MTILDCCISLKMIKKNLVVLGVVDMRQLLLNRLYALPFNGFVVNTPNKLPVSYTLSYGSFCERQDINQAPLFA